VPLEPPDTRRSFGDGGLPLYGRISAVLATGQQVTLSTVRPAPGLLASVSTQHLSPCTSPYPPQPLWPGLSSPERLTAQAFGAVGITAFAGKGVASAPFRWSAAWGMIVSSRGRR
jgi:hypothetical protein